MNSPHNLFELKMSIIGLFFLIFSSLYIEITLKIVGSLFFIAYIIRRWFLMEKHNKNNNLKF